MYSKQVDVLPSNLEALRVPIVRVLAGERRSASRAAVESDSTALRILGRRATASSGRRRGSRRRVRRRRGLAGRGGRRHQRSAGTAAGAGCWRRGRRRRIIATSGCTCSIPFVSLRKTRDYLGVKVSMPHLPGRKPRLSGCRSRCTRQTSTDPPSRPDTRPSAAPARRRASRRRCCSC